MRSFEDIKPPVKPEGLAGADAARVRERIAQALEHPALAALAGAQEERLAQRVAQNLVVDDSGEIVTRAARAEALRVAEVAAPGREKDAGAEKVQKGG